MSPSREKNIFISHGTCIQEILIVIRVYLFFLSHRTTACVQQPLKLVTPRIKQQKSPEYGNGAHTGRHDLLFSKFLFSRKIYVICFTFLFLFLLFEFFFFYVFFFLASQRSTHEAHETNFLYAKNFHQLRREIDERCLNPPHHTSSCVYRVANVKKN